MKRSCLSILLLCLPFAGCAEFGDLGLPGTVSDTGYEGTWRRGNERVYSFVSIVKHEERYLFRINKISKDGRVRISCDWHGKCMETLDGEEVATYGFRTQLNEESGRLQVYWDIQVFKPNALAYERIDELNVRNEGKVLRAWTLKDQVGTYEFRKGGYRDFDKLSNHVVDPPVGWQPQGG